MCGVSLSVVVKPRQRGDGPLGDVAPWGRGVDIATNEQSFIKLATTLNGGEYSKVHPIRGLEGPEVKQMYSSTLPLTSAIDGCGWSKVNAVINTDSMKRIRISFFETKTAARAII